MDRQAILEQLSTLPITTWSYNAEDPHVRHIGPMAQDFKAAFGVGTTDRAIWQVDGDGVAFAAIQALNEKVNRLASENAKLAEQLKDLRSRSTRECTAAGQGAASAPPGRQRSRDMRPPAS